MSKYGLLISSITFIIVLSRCTLNDKTLPVIQNIETSNKSFSIDCIPTSITVTADITDPLGITNAVLWYRVGTDQAYTPVDMDQISGNNYSAIVNALDIPVGKYGTLEFYIAAEDGAGNQSKSPTDASIELLPCVAN